MERVTGYSQPGGFFVDHGSVFWKIASSRETDIVMVGENVSNVP
jgi:hypothetical protein